MLQRRLLEIMAYVSFTVVGACIARPRNHNTLRRYPRADISVRPYGVAALVVLSFRPSEARGEIPCRCAGFWGQSIRFLYSRRGVHAREITTRFAVTHGRTFQSAPTILQRRLLEIMAYVSFTVVGACIARPRNHNTLRRYPRADISVRPYGVAALVVLSFRPSEARGEIPCRCAGFWGQSIRFLYSRRGVHAREITTRFAVTRGRTFQSAPTILQRRLLEIMAYVSFTVVGACIARPRNHNTFRGYTRAAQKISSRLLP